jgi:hypothetical protein
MRTVLVLTTLILCLSPGASAEAQAPVKQAAQTRVTKAAPAAMHKVAIQVNQNDKAVMDLALAPIPAR